MLQCRSKNPGQELRQLKVTAIVPGVGQPEELRALKVVQLSFAFGGAVMFRRAHGNATKTLEAAGR